MTPNAYVTSGGEQALRKRICDVAKTYERTRYHDHGCIKGSHGGVDCASFAMLVMKEVGLVPSDYKLPPYNVQPDRHRVDRTYLDEVAKFAVQIPESDIQPGDLFLYKISGSFIHGAIVLAWPKMIHAVKPTGVLVTDATRDRLMGQIEHRCFSFVKHAMGL